MPIKDEYYRQLQLKGYQEDESQQAVVHMLDDLQHQIRHHQQYRQTLVAKIHHWLGTAEQPPRGCYIWGKVGRGKTWLMDMFFDTLNEHSLVGKQKIRLHFHHFMQAIHDQLSLLGEHKHPLKHIAKTFARRYRVLCLDEFHVADITDAMLLYGLLDNLFSEGVILIATSNQPVDELYKNGLQRERFLPAIQLIKLYCAEIHLDGAIDHRLRILEQADTWYPASSDESRQAMELRFCELSSSPARRNTRIQLNYREIDTVMLSNDIIWLEFDTLCGHQRGSADYIEIARQYHTVFISNIPIMDDSHNDRARRFINMIDEYYDRKVNILVSAEGTPDSLYQGQQLAEEFMRTASRLQEMRSHEYFRAEHRIS